MIGLIRLRAPASDATGCISLDHAPKPPPDRFSGFFVGCTDRNEVTETLEWYEEVRRHRPDIPLGLACPVGPWVLRAVAVLPYSIDPVLTRPDLNGGVLPSDALERMRERSIEGSVLTSWRERFGDAVDEDRVFFSALIAQGVRGGGVDAVSRALHTSARTVHRRARSLTNHKPSTLLLDARVRAHDALLSLGVDKRDGILACGWYTPDAVEKARRRLRRAMDSFRVMAQNRGCPKSGGCLSETGG